MRASKGSRSTGNVLAWFVLATTPIVLSQCNQLPGAKPGSGSGLSDACPADIADAAAIMKESFGMEATLEGKVKAALSAGAHLQTIAVNVEGEVVTACTNLAKDLGVDDAALQPKENGPGKKAEAACAAAAKAINDFKAQAKAKVVIDAKPPQCSASMSAVADCSARCDASVKPGEAKVTCEGGKLSGKCDAKCEGECSVDAAGKCEGTCSAQCTGECKADFSGKCDGTCSGKCDGKDTKGKCAGKCDGSCTGKATGECRGECKGECSGGCTFKAKGECKGTCTGGCSVEFKEPKCTGEVKPPEVSAECKANCDAEVKTKLECTSGHVFAKVDAGANVDAAQKLRAALEKNLPALVKVSTSLKDKLDTVSGNVQASLEGVRAATAAGGAGALKVGACIGASLEAQAKASVSINVSIKASASASASAGAG